MMRILFWNLSSKLPTTAVARLILAHDVDFLILAELSDPIRMLNAINSPFPTAAFHFIPSSSRLGLFARFPGTSLPPFRETEYFTIRRLPAIPNVREEVLVAAAHLPSKLFMRPEGQAAMAARLSIALRAAEQSAGHDRSVVIGDLNMNPFEAGVAGASGLHGLMTRALARGESRVVRGERFPTMYNPMWGVFGERPGGQPGTYYYRDSDEVCYFWNVFDHVLLRPSLLPALPRGGVRVLDGDGVDSFLTRTGRPNAATHSDHLPLFLTLDV